MLQPMKTAFKIFGGTALKNDKFHLQENFLLRGREPAHIHHPQPAL